MVPESTFSRALSEMRYRIQFRFLSIVEAAVAQNAMNRQNPCKGLNRVFFLSSVLGVFPLSYDPDSVLINYRALSISFLIRALCLAGIIHLGTYFFWDWVFSPEDNIDEICVIIQYWATFACIVYIIWNKSELTLLNKYFVKIDSEFMKLGISPSYNVEWLWDVIILVLSLSTFFLVPILLNYDKLTINFCCESLLEAYVAWQCFAVVQPFVQCVRIVGNKLSKVREVFLTLSQSKKYFNTKDKLESTICIYDSLCSTSDLLMDLFSLQLLFVFFMVLLNVIVGSFRLLLTIRTYSKVFDFLSQVLDLTYHIVVCVYITTYCKRTSEEVLLKNLLSIFK